MPIEILMPALSPTMTEGTLAKWNIKEGDTVAAGDVIAEIETDKATMEVEAVDEGKVGKILIDEGSENVAVNTLIALLLEDGEDASALDSYDEKPAQEESEQEGEVSQQDEAPAPKKVKKEKPKANIPDGVVEILMPALSPTMTDGTLAKWNIKEGDTVAAGDVIAEIETDKATMEVEAVDEGTVGKILVEGGSAGVLVNTPIAALLMEGTKKDVLKDYVPTPLDEEDDEEEEVVAATSKASSSAPTKAAAPSVQATKAPEPPMASASSGDRVVASPLAKRLAKEAGINIASVRGTGPHGRVIKEDVEEHVKFGGVAVHRDAGEWTLEKNNTMRKTIAKRLVESKQQVPHFYLSVDCELDALLNVRKQLNDKAVAQAGKDGKPAYKLSVNDLVIKATALAMKDVPASNASWYDDAIVMYSNVDVSVAVAIDGGLVTPVVKNADQKSLPKISAEIKELAGKARSGTLMPEEMSGGGFSVSNLGMFGIKSFSAIINPPQSCILAVGAGEERVVVKNGEMKVANVVTVTLSVDHRSVDGAVGAEFLQAFKRYIESPVTMLA